MKILDDKSNPGELLAGFAMLLWALYIANSLTGCGQILGLREVKYGDFSIKYAEGIDFGFGANSVSRVDNRRGIDPLYEEKTTK